MSEDAATGPQRPVQPAALAHVVRRLGRANEAPWLHVEAARRLAERLMLVRRQPRVVIDWWSFNGAGQSLLRQAYPRARLLRVEADAAPRQRAPTAASSGWWARRRSAAESPCVAPHEVQAGAAELLWSNMMLHWVADPQAEFRQWLRALAVDGFVMFTTLGPGSLRGLRDVYARRGWPVPHAPFIDMHDLGDMLVQCGLADPVMDQETLTLTWADAPAMLAELRALGGNVDPRRWAGLRTPRWRDGLLTELQHLRGADGRLRLDFEVVYGHAFKAAPKARVAERTTVALEDMRTMVRATRRGGPADDGLR
jgi:malonyl-CoA O-methyltransferase